MKENLFVKEMFFYILIGAIIFYFPSLVALTLGLILDNDVLIAFSGAYVLIWIGPFTPTIPVILGIAVVIKQLVKKKKKS